MKSSNLLAVAVLAGMAISPSAHALTFSQSFGTVADTTSPVSMTFGPSTSLNYDASGVLPADTEIVFTYSANKTGGIDLVAGGSNSVVNASAVSFGSASSSSVAPILAFANLGGGAASVTIENTGLTPESFQALFSSLFGTGHGSSFTVGYSVSSVPLPASLVLFGTGLLALVGFSSMRKNRDSI
jgi:uncharacterized protein YraI